MSNRLEVGNNIGDSAVTAVQCPKTNKRTVKHKHNRILHRKLKKYRLRHDGKEDQAILDVSQTLNKVLKIRSPNNPTQEIICTLDDNYPKNYLFKMGRRKQVTKTVESSDSDIIVASSSCEKQENVILPNGIKKKQHTNAFKVMMDSRNKIIGSNSPGKEKTVEVTESQLIDKKAMRVKRNLILQKMAESKGFLKNKELEDYQEQCINKKMQKRTERLKNMLVNKESSFVKKEEKGDYPLEEKSLTQSESESNPVHQSKLTFIEPVKCDNHVSPIRSPITKEDKDFLKKLSPSLKKKESMLCYFKKIERVSPFSTDVENESDDLVIKVKVSSKHKKKAKKKTLSTHKSNLCDDSAKITEVKEHNNLGSSVVSEVSIQQNTSSNERKKRKRKDIFDQNNTKNGSDIISECLNNENIRPKRNIRKPIKYSDDAQLYSSDDEEFHIFTPKKKKHSEDKLNLKKLPPKDTLINSLVSGIKNDKDSKQALKKVDVETNNQKKVTKLAPIFAIKTLVNTAALEAKQKFLQSGVPEKLKKMALEQKHNISDLSIFPTVVHVQQTATPDNNVLIPEIKLNDNLFYNIDFADELLVNCESNLFKFLIKFENKEGKLFSKPLNISKMDTYTCLQNIKKMHPKFPVYRTYLSLRDKCSADFKECSILEMDDSEVIMNGVNDISSDNPDILNWTAKYKPFSCKQIIGNFDNIKELKKWLVTWTENEVKSKKKCTTESDLSDFYCSDTDSKDNMKVTNNLLAITGPSGSGKTSSVYAVAAELAIKVIEVNASSKRTGKIMLQDLQEATQSHKVNRAKSTSENSQKSQEVSENSQKSFKKKGRPKKHGDTSKSKISNTKPESSSQSQIFGSQEIARTEMSLILIDDADIVFEQDDGFCSAILQLVQYSKRPVILITSSVTCLHLQRFLQNAKVITMRPLLPKIFGTWLDLMCLVDNNICLPGLGAKFLDYFHGDIRKSINSLQFYMSSETLRCMNGQDTVSKNFEYTANMEDENSSMSWVDQDVPEEQCTSLNKLEDQAFKCFFNEQLNFLHFSYPLDLFTIWWSIPKCLYIAFESGQQPSKLMQNLEENLNKHNELDVVANVIDALSISDYYRHIVPETSVDITYKPWHSWEYDSVSESENVSSYNSSHYFTDELSHKLITGSIVEAQKKFNSDCITNVEFPSSTVQRERNKIVSRHNTLTNYLNPSSALDRRALALDYWSSCRTICRVEKTRTDNKTKRNNRFCHYLKSLNINCKPDSFDKLGESLCPNGRI